MSFENVVEQILAVTARYDKKVLAETTLNRMIRRISGLARYPQNLYEVSQANSNSEAVVSIDLPERFQALSYVRTSSCRENLGIISMQKSKTTDPGYYITGSRLLIRVPAIEDTILIGWYIHPSSLVNPIDTNWILSTFEHVLVDMVSAAMQGMLGNADAWRTLETYSAQFLEAEHQNSSHPYGD